MEQIFFGILLDIVVSCSLFDGLFPFATNAKLCLLFTCFQHMKFYLMKRREKIMICMGMRGAVLDLMLAILGTTGDILTSQVVDQVDGNIWVDREIPSHSHFPLGTVVVRVHPILISMTFSPIFSGEIRVVLAILVVSVVHPELSLVVLVVHLGVNLVVSAVHPGRSLGLGTILRVSRT